MPRSLRDVAAIALAVHGVIHVLGLVVYAELVVLAELPYKTTLLDGAIDVGDAGIRVFGVVTAVVGVGFVVSAAAIVRDWRYWRPLLVVVTLCSLLVTALDWTVASMGVLANLAILAALVVYPRL